jgi:hypothetical protein
MIVSLTVAESKKTQCALVEACKENAPIERSRLKAKVDAFGLFR